VPDKVMGVLVMFASLGVLFVLPWLDTSKVRSMRYRPTMRWFYFFFIVVCCLLGWCGAKAPDDHPIPNLETFVLGDAQLNSFVWLSRFLTLYYFGYFLAIVPIMGLRETPLQIPATISEPVLPKSHGMAVAPAE
jgi:quinol-cytochrome oxidoreductase complex cytochrome b subunit